MNLLLLFVVRCSTNAQQFSNLKRSTNRDRLCRRRRCRCFNILWCTHQFSLHIYGIPTAIPTDHFSNGNCFSFFFFFFVNSFERIQTNHDTLCMRKTHKFPFALTEEKKKAKKKKQSRDQFIIHI